MTGRLRLVVIVLLVGLSSRVSAQPKPGVSIAPFLGLTSSGRDLLLRPGLTPGTDQESQAIYGVIGARVGVGLTPRFELQADFGVGKSGLQVSSLAAPSGTNAKVRTLAGRLAYWVKPPIEPMWLALTGGVAAVQRSFSERTPGVSTAISDRTNVGGVIGTVIGFNVSRKAAITIGIDAFIYNASFDVAATGSQPAARTQSLTQRDIRVVFGVRIPVVGL